MARHFNLLVLEGENMELPYVVNHALQWTDD